MGLFKKYQLSNTEHEIMLYFWNVACGEDVTAKDVCEYFNANGKSWSERATLIFLRELRKKGILNAEKRNGLLTYWPIMSEEKYELLPVKDLINDRYNGSIFKLACSLYDEDEKLTDEYVEFLRQKIKELDN